MSSRCAICNKSIHPNAASVRCNGACKQWHHATCAKLSKDQLKHYAKEDKKADGAKWICSDCNIPGSSLNVTLGNLAVDQRDNDDIEYIINQLFKKHFSEFKEEIMAHMDKCMETMNELRDRVIKLERENEQLKNEIKGFSEEDILIEMEERRIRERNLMIYNIPESLRQGVTEKIAEDKESVRNVLLPISDLNIDSMKVIRAGKKGPKPRPLKIICIDKPTVINFLKNKNKITHPQAKIGSDLTFKQRKYLQDLRSRLQSRNDDNEKMTIKFFGGIPKLVPAKN